MRTEKGLGKRIGVGTKRKSQKGGVSSVIRKGIKNRNVRRRYVGFVRSQATPWRIARPGKITFARSVAPRVTPENGANREIAESAMRNTPF